MRLTRLNESRDRDNRLVGIVPPPAVPAITLERLFIEAYRRLHGRVLHHAQRFLSADDAHDAVADAMAALWIRWATLTPSQQSDKWIFGVVHRCVLARLRAGRSHVSLEDAEAELDAHAARAFETPTWGDTAADVLDAVLTVMPPRRREVFLLVREESLSYQAAAEVLGLSQNTVHTHMRLATKDLHTAFTRAGFQIADSQPARLKSPKGGANHD